MLSQEINPAGDSYNNINLAQPDKHPPFSLRQHVLACRRTDVWSNWPFPKKYLHMCFNGGIKEVLPPFESHESALQSIRGVVSFHFGGRKDKEKSSDTIVQENECECVLNTEPSISELSVQHCWPCSTSNRSRENEVNENDFSPEFASSSIIMVPTDKLVSTIPSSKEKNEFSPNVAFSSTVVVSADQPSTSIQTTTTLTSIRKLTHKGKRHNGKQKKRKMADILDVAEPCTFEDLLRIKRLCSISSNPHELEDAGTESMVDAENNCESEVTKDYSSEKLETDSKAANVSMESSKGSVVTFNFSKCESNL